MSDEQDVPRPGRNDPCRCGSGLKYKKCHMRQDDDERASRTAMSPAEAARESWLDPFVAGDFEDELAVAEVARAVIAKLSPHSRAAVDAAFGDDEAERPADVDDALVAWAFAWLAWERGDGDELAVMGESAMRLDRERVLDAEEALLFVSRGIEELRGRRAALAWLDTQTARLGAQPGSERLRARLMLEVGDVLLEAHEPERAEQAFREAASLDPADASLVAAWADALLEQGRNQDALEVLDRGAELEMGEATRDDLARLREAAERAAKLEEGWLRADCGQALATLDASRADPTQLWEALGRARRWAGRGRLRASFDDAWSAFDEESGAFDGPETPGAGSLREGEPDGPGEDTHDEGAEWSDSFGLLWVMADVRLPSTTTSFLGAYADSVPGSRETTAGRACLRALWESEIDVVEATEDPTPDGHATVRSLLDGRERRVRLTAPRGIIGLREGENGKDEDAAGDEAGEEAQGGVAEPPVLRFETFVVRTAPAREPALLFGVAIPRRETAAVLRAFHRAARLDLGLDPATGQPRVRDWLAIAGGKIVAPIEEARERADERAPTDVADGAPYEPHVVEVPLAPAVRARALEVLDGSRQLVRDRAEEAGPVWYHVCEQRRGGGRQALSLRLAALRFAGGAIEIQGLSEGSSRRARNLVGRLLSIDVEQLAPQPVAIDDPRERYAIRWRAWMDEPVRGLAGLTAREAARSSPEDRAALAETMRRMEADERRASGTSIETVGLDALAIELGLGPLASPRPAGSPG